MKTMRLKDQNMTFKEKTSYVKITETGMKNLSPNKMITDRPLRRLERINKNYKVL